MKKKNACLLMLILPLLIFLSACDNDDTNDNAALAQLAFVPGFACEDADGDEYGAGMLCEGTEDCDDANENIYPGAVEECDGVDNDCNGILDDDAPKWFTDCDSDGFPASDAEYIQQCVMPDYAPSQGCDTWTSLDPAVPENVDCNDSRDDVYPGAPELCDDYDNDCNGQVNDGFENSFWFTDCDGDGYPSFDAGYIQYCEMPNRPPSSGCDAWTSLDPAVPKNVDCNDVLDEGELVYPGAPELCDGLDNDCDETVDEGCPY